MAQLRPMPPISVDPTELSRFGRRWTSDGRNLRRSPPESSMQFGQIFDRAVGTSLATMLGEIPVITPSMNSLIPSQADCVEVGPVRIVGGVRPQNFDVGYRPDGPRFVFDSKTLNDTKSLGKNFLNMINDLATEATTVHSRFPFSLVAFMFVVPKPCLDEQPRRGIVAMQTLERLAGRDKVDEPEHLAEAISVIVWDPLTGTIDQAIPSKDSILRIEKFSSRIEEIYTARYKGLPPHGNSEENSEDGEGEEET